MANPILSKPDAFTRSPEYRGYAQQQGPYGQAYGQPMPDGQQAAYQSNDVMTLDDVIAKTAIVMGVLFVSAAAAWTLIPIQMAAVISVAISLIGFVTVLIVGSRPRIPVAGVIFYAVVEGVFLGVVSKFFETRYPGIVMSAVVATFVTAGVTLAAYKIFNIRVTPKFQRGVAIATVSFALVMMINFLLSLAGIRLGTSHIGSGPGWLPIAVSAVAVLLAVFNLIVDFGLAERGVAMRAPAHESWRAAFGLTITMVWLYLELLRILSYFRD